MSNDIDTISEAVKTAVACTAKPGIGTEDEFTASDEMGHRYYIRWDIQVFLSIKELKKRGRFSEGDRRADSLFYPNKALGKKRPVAKEKKTEDTGQKQDKDRIPPEFMDIISWLGIQRMKEQNSEEDRYKRLDQRIRDCQGSFFVRFSQQLYEIPFHIQHSAIMILIIKNI